TRDGPLKKGDIDRDSHSVLYATRTGFVAKPRRIHEWSEWIICVLWLPLDRAHVVTREASVRCDRTASHPRSRSSSAGNPDTTCTPSTISTWPLSLALVAPAHTSCPLLTSSVSMEWSMTSAPPRVSGRYRCTNARILMSGDPPLQGVASSPEHCSS